MKCELGFNSIGFRINIQNTAIMVSCKDTEKFVKGNGNQRKYWNENPTDQFKWSQCIVCRMYNISIMTRECFHFFAGKVMSMSYIAYKHRETRVPNRKHDILRK